MLGLLIASLLLTMTSSTEAILASDGQADYRLRGKVVDQEGNPIPNAAISLVSVDRGRRVEFEVD